MGHFQVASIEKERGQLKIHTVLEDGSVEQWNFPLGQGYELEDHNGTPNWAKYIEKKLRKRKEVEAQKENAAQTIDVEKEKEKHVGKTFKFDEPDEHNPGELRTE